ncbi:MAG: dicarboxylate/amino acid:cation symporter [Bacillota bacterium]|nr:dicarboxylate/amino acid:cation symporter [Bacillota bacterium]
MLKAVIPAQISGISEGLDFIEASLKQLKFNTKAVHEAMLLSEESMVHLMQNAPAESTVHIHIKKRNGLASISLSAPGPGLEADKVEFDLGIENDVLDRSVESAIRGILMKAYQDKIHYARKGRYNFMNITVGSPEKVLAVHTLWALMIATVLGLILRFAAPTGFLNILDTYVLVPIETLFIKFLMLVTAPAVFFSIISAVARYTSFSGPGRVGAKVFIGYALTSVAAVLIGTGLFSHLTPGVPGDLAEYVLQKGISANTDLFKTVLEIIPTNIIEPFLSTNTLQLIFVAIVCGIALGRMGDYSTALRNFSEAMDTLFTKIIEIIAKCVPLASFAATLSCLLNVKLRVLLSLLGMVGVLFAALLCISLVYVLIVLIFGRVNPFLFIRKCWPVIREAFITGSSVSAIPKTVRTCKNSLGISTRISSFSIPFGAIVNVDGNCIYLAIAGLFLARACGVDIFGTELISIMITVFILSIGAPMAPGSVNICLTVLLTQMGVSMGAISLIIGINALAEMLLAASNVVGDVAVSLAVAKSEGLLNTEVFNARPRKRISV